MVKSRKIKKIISAKPTLEGAGVHLKRVFGFHEIPMFDPFLLLDDFRSDYPEDFIKGFPWHPHRGIETITYVLKGDVEHGDSLGNKGIISSGDVQWMTAGSGIIHAEMPKGDKMGHMHGFQLWANLPAKNKMMDPKYRDIKSDQIPEIITSDNINIKIIAGKVENQKGPVQDIIINPELLDITIPPDSLLKFPTISGYTVFAYVIDGSGLFSEEKTPAGNTNLVLFEDGDEILIRTSDHNVRFLLISGKPLGEKIAWAGPIVMNTKEELKIAFEEYNNGTFIK
jgi:redox-sensitive bicupin YhaK (pirin superfamily)